MVKKNCSCSKNIERGQNIFELAESSLLLISSILCKITLALSILSTYINNHLCEQNWRSSCSSYSSKRSNKSQDKSNKKESHDILKSITANVYRELQGLYREIGVHGFQIYGDCMYTRNPCNFEISTIWFPCKNCRDLDFTGIL